MFLISTFHISRELGRGDGGKKKKGKNKTGIVAFSCGFFMAL